MINNVKYDYIIAGAGCAGLSLLYRILKDPYLCSKKILVVDKIRKVQNDRTWCFWEKESGFFESIVSFKWNTLEFISSDFKKQFEIEKYTYKMIKGEDFYSYVISFAQNFPNVDFKYEIIQEIKSTQHLATLSTENGSYSSELLFNSTSLFLPKINASNTLLQHFVGWIIDSETTVFNRNIGTLMDFRLNQDHGTTFMYVLPMSSKKALVEYTLFSEAVLAKEEYNLALSAYIKDFLKINSYQIIHKESGAIPMSLARFSRNIKSLDRVVNIGTAGGSTKASSGYTFQFIQKHADQILENLRSNKIDMPKLSYREKKFQWYDRTLIDVLLSKKLSGSEIFTGLFKDNNGEMLLAFLGNESTFTEELKIMSSVPTKHFLFAGIKQLFK